jgi:hypothetical protein
MSVGARVLKYQQLRAYAKVPQPPVKIYSDPLHGAQTVDGYARRYSYGNSWIGIHSEPGNEAYPDSTVMGAAFVGWTLPHTWLTLARTIMTFYIDPAKVPPGAEVTLAKFKFWPYQVYDHLAANPAWCLVQSTPLSDNNIIPSDYLRTQATRVSDVLPMASVVLGVFNTLTMLDEYLSLVQPGSILRLGFRESVYDVTGLEPPWGSLYGSGIDVLSTDSAYRPYLEVTFNA